MRVLPNFIIIGAAKAGSTWLAHALRQHPDVYIETGGFNMFSQENFDDSCIDALSARMSRGAGRKAIGFKRPFLAEPDAPQRVRSIVPDCRLLVLLRDPVPRAVSGYFQAMEGGAVPVLPVDEGMARLLDVPEQRRDPKSWRVIDEGMYGKHLGRWLSHFPREQFLIQIAEEARTEPATALRAACEFLGLGMSDDLASAGSGSSNPGHYSMTHQRIGQMLRPLYVRRGSDGQWRHRRGPVGKLSQIVFKRLIDDRLLMRFYKTPAPKVSESMHRRLAELFRDDLTALETLLGRDLDVWPTARMLREHSQTP